MDVYLAMFDEYDESTAIAKAATDADAIPEGEYFLTLDADGVSLPSDYYLRFAGVASGTIRSGTPRSAAVPIGPDVSRLPPGGRLTPDRALFSPARAFRLVFQRDGNLVLYREADGAALRASGRPDDEPGFAVMQGDGNLVVHAADGRATWSSGTEGNPGGALALGDDGALEIRDAGGTLVWRSASP